MPPRQPCENTLIRLFSIVTYLVDKRGVNMKDPIVSRIIDLLIDLCTDAFSGIQGKFQLFNIKRRLKKQIFNEILSKYGDRVFYNDLDHFLTDNDVICNVIRNCCDVSVFHYKSKSQTIDYYVQLFVEQHPRYSRYHYEIRTLLQRYFEVIYLALNKSNNNETRVICNVAKELAHGLLDELQDIKSAVEQLDKKVDVLVNEPECPPTKFLFDEYRKHLLCLYPRYPVCEYLERKIYPKNESDVQLNSLDVLLKEKHVLVLGEAGYGKTYESIILLQRACTNEKTRTLIPVFISLQEYGLLYTDIIGGIKYKITPFCDGEVDKIIEQQLKEGRFLLIMDGIDDITQDDYRTKFYAEFNNFTAQYSTNFFFITSRFNRYHGELGEKKQYFLTALSEQTIRQELRKDGIVVDIPRHYYMLFSNPFFLSVGKSVLKQSTNRDIFNRSRLFEELFQKLYGGISQQGQFAGRAPLTYHDAQTILGNFAYHTFSQPSYSYTEFDQQLSKIVHENKTHVIGSFVGSGLFRIEDKVVFVHKLFKEYCVAHYLVHNFPLSHNVELYMDLVEKDEWKEVFIFAGGIFKEAQAQDEFLDFVMEHNLPLYIECVNAKSDVNESDIADSAKRLLTQIHRTYRFILSKYFSPIEALFDPLHTPYRFTIEPGQKVAIIGCLSEDKSHLSYWFDFVSADESDVQCINEQQCKEYHTAFEKKALFQRRNFVSYGVNLQLSGLSEDSGRKIAINLIKKRLKDLIEKKNLIESKHLLCERIAHYQRKVKEIKGIDNLLEMQAVIDKMVNDALEKNPCLAGYTLNGVELFSLRDLLHYLNQTNTVLSEHILPGPDMPIPARGSCFTWDCYSKEQKERRIALFFYYHEISYLSMVEYNFPILKKYFQRYNDAPYQVVVEVDHNEEANPHDFTSEPSIQYHYIASPTEDIPMPAIRQTREKNFFDYDQIVKDIQESYLKQGRTANHIMTTRTGFTFTTTSRRTGGDDPLSDYVYSSIKESLEDVFGSMR